MRADTRRDERSAEPSRPLEEFLRGLLGWLPPRRDSEGSVHRLRMAVDKFANELDVLSDSELSERFHSETRLLKEEFDTLQSGDRLPRVLACVAEAARRRLGVQPHSVQLAGTRSLLSGELAEMQTGEGKTLVAAMAATVMSAAGAFVHVISTNDYLAKRDAERMSPLFAFFGLHAGYITSDMEIEGRRRAYANPICYAAGKEVVFDYLKDGLQGHGAAPVKVSDLQGLWADPLDRSPAPLIPALHFAIVDEADSVLIDEARTPMILSRESPPMFSPELLDWAISSARALRAEFHFKWSLAREIELLPAANSACPPTPASAPAVWQSRVWREHLIHQALVAIHLYRKDQHYIISDGKVQIVDESTGRTMPDRSWEQGLHQLIETKEQVPVTNGRDTLSRMTYQRFFRRYFLISGLTGTAAEAARELWSIYGLRVRRIPTNRPSQRTRLPSKCEATQARKWTAIVNEAVEASGRGQPVLIGTRSVQASERIASELLQRAVPHVVLNARQDADEASVVTLAGHSGRITVATNMAGRGTDIKLDPDALKAGGMHVILSEFHESPRVDRQLFGRCGRQGEPGTARAIVSTEDALFDSVGGGSRLILARTGGALQRVILSWVVRQAQARAERRALRARLQTMRQDRELKRMIGFAGHAR